MGYWNVRRGGFINLRQALPESLFYLVPAALIGALAVVGALPDGPLWAEISWYALLLTIVGFRCFRLARTLELAVSTAALVVTPVLSWALINLAATIACLSLDSMGVGPDLGWRAPLSALAILTVSLLSIVTGATVGLAAKKLQER